MTREEARADLMLAQADISYRPKDDSIDIAIIALKKQEIMIDIKYDLYNIQDYTKEAKTLLRDNKIISVFENLTAIQESLKEIYSKMEGENK